MIRHVRIRNSIVRRVRGFVRDARGATAIEYGLILALITLVMIVALVQLADTTTDIWDNVSDKVQKAH